MQLRWHVNGREGVFEILSGENHLSVPVRPGGVFMRVLGELEIPPAPKMFFNGYQSWTHCPEFTPLSSIRGLNGIPKPAAALMGVDHFGDYHFVPYPNQKGILQGFSWCYFREGERYRLLASLDENPGYTMFLYNAAGGKMILERDCRGVAVRGEEFSAFDLFYAEGSGDEVFDGWFDALGIRNHPPALKGYSSWYNHYRNINERRILDVLNGTERVLEPGDLFQIDDGWETAVGDWLEPDRKKFPHGMAPLAREIHERGYRAGLWLAPFICERRSGLFREHPDRLLRYQGKPWKSGPNWSGHYALDIDHPGVKDHLARVFRRVFDDWKFDLVKLDFLYAAAPLATGDHGTSADGPFSESRAARMIRALTFLRGLCGDKLILGCGVPLMPAFGLVDYCRVGCDDGITWNDFPLMRVLHRERASIRRAIGNTVSRSHLNGRAFGNDPDVFFLRDRNIRLSAEQKTYLAVLNLLFGSVWLTSDDLNTYDERKIARCRQLLRLRDAADVRIDRGTFEISCTLSGQTLTFPYPQGGNERTYL